MKVGVLFFFGVFWIILHFLIYGKSHTDILPSHVCFGLTLTFSESTLPKLCQIAVVLSADRLTKQMLLII